MKRLLALCVVLLSVFCLLPSCGGKDERSDTGKPEKLEYISKSIPFKWEKLSNKPDSVDAVIRHQGDIKKLMNYFTPIRSNVYSDIIFELEDNNSENEATKKTAASPKIKPVNGREKPPSKGRVIPLIIIIPAPKDAPDETPRI